MAEQRRRRRAPCAPEARPRSPSSPWGRWRPPSRGPPPPGARPGPGGGAAGRPGPLAGRLCPGAHVVSAIAAPALAPDLEAALRRLKLAAVRRLAPELLVPAKTQRWAPDELLRTLLEAELAAPDASNARARPAVAGFPGRKTLEELLVPA